MIPNIDDNFFFVFKADQAKDWIEEGTCCCVGDSKDGRCYIFEDINERDRFKRKIVIPMTEFPKGSFRSFGTTINFEFTFRNLYHAK